MTHTLGNKESFETPTLEFKEVEKELTQNYLKEGNIKIKTDKQNRTLPGKINKVQDVSSAEKHLLRVYKVQGSSPRT